MNKKRQYVFVIAILFCDLVFSQHPHSRGGNPLYWAVVGGIASGALFIIYLGFIFLKDFLERVKSGDIIIKDYINSFFSKVKLRVISPIDDKTAPTVLSGEIPKPEIANDNEIHFCRYCGKRLMFTSIYCPYCGKKLQGQSCTFWEKLSLREETVKIVVRSLLKVAIVIILSLIISFVMCSIIGEKNDDAAIGYLLPPIVGYFLYKIILFAYSLSTINKKRLGIGLIAVTFVVMSIETIFYIRQSNNEETLAETVSPHIINRSFLGVSFGDSHFKVSMALKKAGYTIYHNIDDQVCLTKTDYGKYAADSIFFNFHDGKFMSIFIVFNSMSFEDYYNDYTYKSISDLLEKKYPNSKDYTKYNNVMYYSDAYTEVRLWHKGGDKSSWYKDRENNKDFDSYSVTLRYYDKTSGYREERDKDF